MITAESAKELEDKARLFLKFDRGADIIFKS